MRFYFTRMGLAAAALGGLAATATAQPRLAERPEPQVIKWAGGYMVTDGRGVVVWRSGTGTGGSTNVITGSGNGVGNRIVVDGGGSGGVTIVRGSRIGVGNTIVVNPDGVLVDLDQWLKPCPKPAPARPEFAPKPMTAPEPLPNADAAPTYKGKANAFWAEKAFSEALDCNLYWCPQTKLWFRYHADDDTYRPVPAQPAVPADERE